MASSKAGALGRGGGVRRDPRPAPARPGPQAVWRGEDRGGAAAAPFASAQDPAYAPGRPRVQPFPGVGPVGHACSRTVGGDLSSARPRPPRRAPQSLRGAPALAPSRRCCPDKDCAGGWRAPRGDLALASLPLSPAAELGRRCVAAAGQGLAAPSDPFVWPSRWHFGEWLGQDMDLGVGAKGHGGLLADAKT